MSPHHTKPRVRCKGPDCKARIFWAKTEAGKPMAFDSAEVPFEEAMEDDRGLFWFGDDGRALAWKAAILTAFGKPIYRAHWASCKNADDFRRGRR